MRAIGTVLTKSISARVTEEEYQTYMARGGSEYLRQVLSGDKGGNLPVVSEVDVEAIVRRVLAEGKVSSPVAPPKVPKAAAEKLPQVEINSGVNSDIADSIKSMFGM